MEVWAFRLKASEGLQKERSMVFCKKRLCCAFFRQGDSAQGACAAAQMYRSDCSTQLS